MWNFLWTTFTVLCFWMVVQCWRSYVSLLNIYPDLLIYFLEEQIFCVCQNPKSVYLRMRGLCPNSFVDNYWKPKNVLNPENKNGIPMNFMLGARLDLKTKEKILSFKVGIETSSIIFNFSTEEWNLKVGSRPTNPTATSSSPFQTFLLGRSSWTISGDSTQYHNLEMDVHDII